MSEEELNKTIVDKAFYAFRNKKNLTREDVYAIAALAAGLGRDEEARRREPADAYLDIARYTVHNYYIKQRLYGAAEAVMAGEYDREPIMQIAMESARLMARTIRNANLLNE